MKFELSKMKWLNEPKTSYCEEDKIILITEPNTDYWQRTYYGFQNMNAPALVTEVCEDFTFTMKCEFESKCLYDQCGIVLYCDDENWAKASMEYENENISRLGSVVTNFGYSDWATTDISTNTNTLWYSISRKGADFLFESSRDGKNFTQMRLFHMHNIKDNVQVGIYACSPKESSFKAVFSEMCLENSKWREYQNGEGS